MKTELPESLKNELYDYLNACSNFYGLISLKKILNIYNKQNKPITEDQFLNYVDNLNYEHEYFRVFGVDEMYEDYPPVKPIERDLVTEYLYSIDDEEYFEMREKQVGLSYYVPEKRQLLKYADQFYFEKTPEFISLRAFLRNLDIISKETADSIADDLHLCAQMDNCDIDNMINTVNLRGINLKSTGREKEFVELCFELDKNTRKHIFCGHTSKELFG